MNKKIKLLLVCFVFGIIFKSKAQQTSFAVGNTTQNERNSKMSDRNGNLNCAYNFSKSNNLSLFEQQPLILALFNKSNDKQLNYIN